MYRGQTWTACAAGFPASAVIGLAVSPAYSNDRALFALSAAGVHVSRNGGSTWEQCPGVAGSATALATGLTDQATRLVVVAREGGALFTSVDAARTWRALPAAFEQAGGRVGSVTRLLARSDTVRRDEC